MFDIVLNFSELFSNCFSSNNIHSKDHQLELLKGTIALETDNDIIISIILMKLCNGTFLAGLLYKYSPSIELVRSVGHFDHTVITNFNTISIPLFKDQKLRYTLNLVSTKKVKFNNERREIIDLLNKYLL